MRRLFLTRRSPYARKVWLACLRKHLPVTLELVDLAVRSPEFVALSPLGKVPVLVDEDGTVVCDSTVICEYLEDRYEAVPLRPQGWEARLALRELEELGDSLADQAIAVWFGRQKGDSAAVDKATRISARILDTIEASAPPPGGSFLPAWSYADAAILSALGYVEFRLGPGWREGRPALTAWFEVADAEPDAVTTRPVG